MRLTALAAIQAVEERRNSRRWIGDEECRGGMGGRDNEGGSKNQTDGVCSRPSVGTKSAGGCQLKDPAGESNGEWIARDFHLT